MGLLHPMVPFYDQGYLQKKVPVMKKVKKLRAEEISTHILF